MTTFRNNLFLSWRRLFATAAALIVALPLTMGTTARADDDDDDWDDDVEEYYEDLEERREEARERWEEWREDREDALEDWYEDGSPRHYHYGPGYEYRAFRHPVPRYYEYHAGPVYEPYYMEPPRYYRHKVIPRERYYGSPRIGYSEFGRHRTVQFGPIRVHWDDD